MISQMLAFVFSNGPAPSSSYMLADFPGEGRYVSYEKRVHVSEIHVENSHEGSHVVFKEFRNVLTIQVDI